MKNADDAKIPVLIDCDPGHDDAIALMLAFGSGRLDVLGLVPWPNGTGANTHRNARKVLSTGRGRSHRRGADRPLLRDLITAPSVHGASLDGPKLPEVPEVGKPVQAIDLITGVLSGNDDRRTVWIATGPLTNVAIALLAKPHIKDNIERIVIMGGSTGAGNWTPSAEFNIHVDPEAAKVVFQSGVPLTMIGLDVTHKALVYPDEVERMRASGRVGKVAAELLDSTQSSTADEASKETRS